MAEVHGANYSRVPSAELPLSSNWLLSSRAWLPWFGVAVLACLSWGTRADDTVGYLRDSCVIAEMFMNEEKDKADMDMIFKSAFCLGYIEGMGVVLQFNCLDDQYRGRIKSTAGTSNAQRVRAFLNWANAHPEHWNDKKFVSMAGLIEGLPCE
ncbi:MAG: hypothetical protein U1E17_24830 [Geminicoccaceae bacterium]